MQDETYSDICLLMDSSGNCRNHHREAGLQ